MRRFFSSHVLKPRKGDRVVLGMSGGVDSSVVAKLLSEREYDLSAVFMRNWDKRDETATDEGCEWKKDWEDVQSVCKLLDIPCKMIDLSREYWLRVFEPSLREWEAGLTPNPDILCNQEIKFGALLDHIPKDIGLTSTSWFATGHYAQKGWSVSTITQPPRPQLLQAVDQTKDQTYYLSSISENSLSRTLFPIGHLRKTEVRELALKHGLPTAKRPESMGICFVGERARFSDFISQYLQPNPGEITDLITKTVVGQHKGLWQYTIGENAKVAGMPERMFVAEKDVKNNTIFVCPGDHEALYSKALHVVNFRWIWADTPVSRISSPDGARAHVKYRHRMDAVSCTLHSGPSDTIVITFDEPQKSIAPGQFAAVWDGNWCLGSGLIQSTDTLQPHSASANVL